MEHGEYVNVGCIGYGSVGYPGTWGVLECVMYWRMESIGVWNKLDHETYVSVGCTCV